MATNTIGQDVKSDRGLASQGTFEAALTSLATSFSNLVGQVVKRGGQSAVARAPLTTDDELLSPWGPVGFEGAMDPSLKQGDLIPACSMPLPVIDVIGSPPLHVDAGGEEPACIDFPPPVGSGEPTEPACWLPLPTQWEEPAPVEEPVCDYPLALEDDRLTACLDYPQDLGGDRTACDLPPPLGSDQPSIPLIGTVTGDVGGNWLVGILGKHPTLIGAPTLPPSELAVISSYAGWYDALTVGGGITNEALLASRQDEAVLAIGPSSILSTEISW